MDYFLNIPNKVYGILNALNRAGYEAFVVGGCVRDVLMGKEPNDWDITTSATPVEVEHVFSDERIIETGLKHGTVMVVIGGEGFEITTFRSDGAYTDGRHPDSVRFSKDIKEDLARRDFTMNALAYSPAKGIVDEFDGIEDIKRGVVRCVGDPDRRFSEDVLRVMRAIRFVATLSGAEQERMIGGDDQSDSERNTHSKYYDVAHNQSTGPSRQLGMFSVLFGPKIATGFTLDTDTESAVRRHAVEVKKASIERVNQEFVKLIVGPYASYAVKKFRRELDLILSRVGLKIAGKRNIKTLSLAPKDVAIRLALILETVENDSFKQTLKRMKFDNTTSKRAAAIKAISDYSIAPEEPVVRLEMRKLAGSFADDDVPDILADGISVKALTGKLSDNDTEKYFDLIYGIVDRGECYSRAGLAVTGGDLKESGVTENEKIGKVLDALLDEVIAGEIMNERDPLIARAGAIAKMF